MKYRRFPAFVCAVLFIAVFSVSITVNAGSDKHELTAIEDLNLHQQGLVILRGDTDAWDEALLGWEWVLSSLTAIGGMPEMRADLELESIDTSDVDLNTPGTYHVRAKMRLADAFAEDYYISDTNRTIVIPVYVSDEAGLKLHLVLDASFSYKFAWYSPDENLPIEIEYLETSLDTKYTEKDLTDAPWAVCDDDNIATTTMSTLSVYKPIPQDRAYYFRVKIGNNYTDAVRVTYTDPPAKPDKGDGGNRDGDDSVEPVPPPFTQPAPDTSTPSGDASASQDANPSVRASSNQGTKHVTGPADMSVGSGSGQNRPPSEVVTENRTTMSGARIHTLLNSGEPFVTFAWDGICLRIPKEFFDTLNLADDSLFDVEMKRTGRDSFTLAITCNGTELREFTALSLQFSMNDSEGPYTLYLNSSRLDTAITYQDGYAVFDITQTGTYQLRTEAHTDTVTTENVESNNNGTLLPIVAAVIIICITGIFVFIRLRARGGTRL